MKLSKKTIIILTAIILTAIVLFVALRLWLDATWFSKLGFLQIFTTILWSKVGLWSGFFVLFFLFTGINIRAAFRKGDIKELRIQRAGESVEINKKSAILFSAIALFLLSIFMANKGSQNWETVLKFFNSTGFNLKDPIYHRDVSFYVFILPLYLLLKSWILTTLILSIVAVGLLYLSSGQIKWDQKKLTTSDQAKRHILILLLMVTVILAWNFWLARFQILFASSGLIFGADYTDANIVRPAYIVMIAVSLLTALLIILSMTRNSLKPIFIGAGIFFGSMVLFLGIIPGIVQQFIVKPNELQKESPYIEANIQFTREGYNLSNVIKQVFPVEDSLTVEDFMGETGITEHVRLWDQRPLKATFSQLQEFRIYYTFNSVNVDRYHFGDEYRQVMISAREINTDNLPQSAQTWINKKLQYTHGYVIVMAPVNEIGQEGLPDLKVSPFVNTVLKQV